MSALLIVTRYVLTTNLHSWSYDIQKLQDGFAFCPYRRIKNYSLGDNVACLYLSAVDSPSSSLPNSRVPRP